MSCVIADTKVMKKLLIVIVILILAEIGATFYFGNLAEQRFRQVVSVIGEIPGTTTSIDSYKKNLFYSNAKVTIKTFGGLLYTFDSVIHHGPIVFQPLMRQKQWSSPIKFLLASVTNQLVSITEPVPSTLPTSVVSPDGSTMPAQTNPLNPSEPNPSDLNPSESGKSLATQKTKVITPPIPIVWVINIPYAGDMSITSQGPAFETNQDQIYIKSTGWNTLGHAAKDGKHLDIESQMGGLAIGKFPEKLAYIQFDGIKFKNEFNQTSEIKSSQSLTTIDKISSPVFPAVGNFLKLQMDVTTHPETLDFLFGISLDSMQLEKGQPSFGPERFEINISNIDLEALKLVRDLSAQEKQLSSEDVKKLTNAILKRKPKVVLHKIELNFPESAGGQVPQGKILLEATLTVGNTTDNGPLGEVLNFNQAWNTVNGDIDSTITKALFRSIIMNIKMTEILKDPNLRNMNQQQRDIAVQQAVDQIIAEFSREGILREQSDSYQVKIKITQGQLVSPETGTPIERVGSQTTAPGSAAPGNAAPAAPVAAPASPENPAPGTPGNTAPERQPSGTATPGIPGMSTSPAAPNAPAIPGKAAPGTPEIPATPGNATPISPVNPATPEMPTKPSTSATPETSSGNPQTTSVPMTGTEPATSATTPMSTTPMLQQSQ